MQGVLPVKRAQPTHLLKFRNMAYGFDTPGPGVEPPGARMQVDGPETKKKKRKSEGRGEGTPTRKKVHA